MHAKTKIYLSAEDEHIKVCYSSKEPTLITRFAFFSPDVKHPYQFFEALIKMLGMQIPPDYVQSIFSTDEKAEKLIESICYTNMVAF